MKKLLGFLSILLLSSIQPTVNAEAVADAAADGNPDADRTARSGHIGKTIKNVASNIAHFFDGKRKKKPKRKPVQPSATEIRFVAVRVPVQAELNLGPAYVPVSPLNLAYNRPPSQSNAAYGPPPRPSAAYAPPSQSSQPSTAYRPPSQPQRRPSYSPPSNSRPPAPIRPTPTPTRPSYKPVYVNPNPPPTLPTTTRRPPTWRTTTWRTTTKTTLRPTPQPPAPTVPRPTTPQPPPPTLQPSPPTFPPQSGENFDETSRQSGNVGQVSRQRNWVPPNQEGAHSWQRGLARQEEREFREKERTGQQQSRSNPWQSPTLGVSRFQQPLGQFEENRSGFPLGQQDASAAGDPNTGEPERAFLPIEVLLGVVAGLLTILLLLLAAVLIVLYRRQKRQQAPVKKNVKKEEVVLNGLPSFPGPKPPPKPPKPLPRDPDPAQRRLPPPPPAWHPPVIYALPGPADPWSQRNTHQSEEKQEEFQVRPKIQSRPELQQAVQSQQMNFQQKPVGYMQEASQSFKRAEAGWREASPPRTSPPRQPHGVPRQPPPASLDEIQSNQLFRQRSEQPVLPPKPTMPQRGSKLSSTNPGNRKISDTTDPEVWGSDFQEVADDSVRVVALYSYNGEEPGTLKVQPGQQFRLVT